ncbi:MAG: hypothetical protein Q4G66_06170 [bacterium]|nr:hypothetical protein [bacterium]
MYLARKENGPNRYEFVLRESYRRGEYFACRDVARLGRDPGDYLVYSGNNAFHIDETLIQHLRAQGVSTPYAELEDLFFPYVDPQIRIHLEPFRMRGRNRNWKRADDSLRRRALEETHVFDRRRLHYLRLGRSSVQAVEKTPALYISLLDKSRDEIEQHILLQEQILQARDLHYYLFSIFDLQRHFQESYARSMPHALEQGKVDVFFLEELCSLAQDERFWLGYPVDLKKDALPYYLRRYLFMYFDLIPEELPHWRASFSGRSRRFSSSGSGAPGPDRQNLSRQDALAVFSLSAAELGNLDKKGLTRLYRKKAQEMHPDKGGDAEAFIRLTSAYEQLLPSLR